MNLLELDRIEIAFNEFHAEHPEVYRKLVTLAKELGSYS